MATQNKKSRFHPEAAFLVLKHVSGYNTGLRCYVKIAIFHSESNREAAYAIGNIITGHSVTVEYHDTKTIWDKRIVKNPLNIMERVSHMLFVYSQDVKDLSSLIFFSGYCLGKGIRIIVLETDSAIKLPENCRHLGIFLKPESFEEYFTAEKIRFGETDLKERSRAELLERGISCYEENFLLIISSGDIDSVSLFLKAGFSPNLADSKGIPALSIAVRSQVPEIVEMLVKAGADVNKLSGDRGYSPLMDAVQKGDLAMGKILLDSGANPDLKSKDGQTALIIGVGRCDTATVSMLLSRGANPDISDNLGMSAAAYSRLFKNEKMTELFNTQRA
jgi:hypothetical protein